MIARIFAAQCRAALITAFSSGPDISRQMLVEGQSFDD
jgi:hypothetical protein